MPLLPWKKHLSGTFEMLKPSAHNFCDHHWHTSMKTLWRTPKQEKWQESLVMLKNIILSIIWESSIVNGQWQQECIVVTMTRQWQPLFIFEIARRCFTTSFANCACWFDCSQRPPTELWHQIHSSFFIAPFCQLTLFIIVLSFRTLWNKLCFACLTNPESCTLESQLGNVTSFILSIWITVSNTKHFFTQGSFIDKPEAWNHHQQHCWSNARFGP